MSAFTVPYVVVSKNDNGSPTWGPPLEVVAEGQMSGGLSKFSALPYAPFGRSDRLGRAADFSQGDNNKKQFHDFNQRYGRSKYTARNSMDTVKENGDGEEAFQLVDTTKAATTKRFVNPASKRRQHTIRLRQINARRQQSAGGGAPTLDKVQGRGASGHLQGGRGGGGRGGGAAGGRGGRGGGRGFYGNRQPDRQPSVAVQSDWKQVEEIELGKLTKNLVTSTTVPAVNDVLWCGFLDPYNDSYDKVTTKAPVPLKRMEHKEFYPVTTTDDPVLEKLAIDGAGQVFITDTILAHLMTCTRSVYPWDIVITRLPGGTIFFDKRDNSQLDYLTVQETAYSPPTDEEGINSPERLGLEATMIHQNFSQQILKQKGPRKSMDLPNPFFDPEDADPGMEPASVAYRYRKFNMESDTNVICRTELHATVKGSQYMTAFALNEYTPSPLSDKDKDKQQQQNNNPAMQLLSWREKIDSQRGAVLATEFKNNSFKLAKWTAQSLLAEADQMKMGFITRANPKIAYEHVILATQFYRPRDLATQITLQEGQMWAIFRMFVTLIQKQKEDGKYVLMRDPNKSLLHLYKVPNDTFEDEE